MTLLAVSDAAAMAIVGLLLLWFASARLRRRYAKSPEKTSGTQAPPVTRFDGPHLDAPSAVAQWEVAMHETARDLMGRLDTKIVIVEQLVRQAHEAADRIEALLVRLEHAGGQGDTAAPSQPANQAADGPSTSGE